MTEREAFEAWLSRRYPLVNRPGRYRRLPTGTPRAS